MISLILKEYSRWSENTVDAFVMILLLDLAALAVTVVWLKYHFLLTCCIWSNKEYVKHAAQTFKEDSCKGTAYVWMHTFNF